MSLIKNTIKKLAATGELTHEFKIGEIAFVLRSLTTEEQLLADTMVDVRKLKDKYNAHEQLSTLPDTISKFRSIAQAVFSIKTVDGQMAIDTSKSFPEQFKQRMELRDELLELGPVYIDRIISEYKELQKKQKEFLGQLNENVEK